MKIRIGNDLLSVYFGRFFSVYYKITVGSWLEVNSKQFQATFEKQIPKMISTEFKTVEIPTKM